LKRGRIAGRDLLLLRDQNPTLQFAQRYAQNHMVEQLELEKLNAERMKAARWAEVQAKKEQVRVLDAEIRNIDITGARDALRPSR